jgi:hypothetical protein
MKSESERHLVNKTAVSEIKETDNNDLANADIDSASYLFDAALRELDALFNSTPTKIDLSLKYLLSLWANFSIFQLDPIAPLIKEDEVEGGVTEGEGGSSSNSSPRIIRLQEGWKILDFGDGLVTSAGENYGSYCTGPLLKTVSYMLDCLAERGAKKVIFSGTLAAKRFAWLRCKQSGIETRFVPKEADHKCEVNIERIQRNLLSPIIRLSN